MEWQHFLDPETGCAQLAFELAPSVEVHAHARDASVSHPAVAKFGLPQECSPGLTPQPLPSLTIAEVEPQIVDVKGESTTGPQDAPRLCKRAAPRCAAADHSQRAEHRQGVIENMVGETAEPTEIGLNAIDLDLSVFRFESDGVQHRPRQIDGGYREASPGEPNRMPAHSAPQVDQPAGRHEPCVERLLVGPEQRVIGKVRVLLGGQASRVRVFPERCVHSVRQPPCGGNSRYTHGFDHVRESSSLRFVHRTRRIQMISPLAHRFPEPLLSCGHSCRNGFNRAMAFDLFGGRRLLLAGSRLGWLWIAALAVALVLLLVLYREERRLVTRRAGLLLLALRLSAAVALALALFEPIAARSYFETLRGRVLVAVDVSGSMETADLDRPVEERAKLTKLLALSPGEPAQRLSRREIARRLIHDRDSPIRKLTLEHNVEVAAFNRDTSMTSLPALDESLRKPRDPADPSSQTTNWQPSLAEALKSSSGDAPLIGIVLLSDGRQNATVDPLPSVDRLAARGVPIFPVQIGSTVPPRDAAVATLKAPEIVYRGDSAGIEATIKLDGYDGREVAVTLEREGASQLRQTVRAPSAQATTRPVVSFPVPFDVVGAFAVTVAVGPLEGDTRPDNDRRTVLVQVVDDKASVLLVGGDAGWEFRYLHNALARDSRVSLRTVVLDQPTASGGIKNTNDTTGRPFAERKATMAASGAIKNTYETALPPRPDESEKTADPLGSFDAILIGDIDPAGFDSRVWSRLDSYVADRGGTLVISSGARYWAALAGQEAFRKLAPVTEPHLVAIDPALNDPAHPALPPGIAVLPSWGRIEASAWPMLQLDADPEQNRSTWARLPRLPWVVAGRVKPGAVALAATSGDESAAVIASSPYGLGKVLWIGGDTWRWRYRAGDRFHHRFWGQVVRWAASGRLAAGNAFVRFGPSKPRIADGENVRVQARESVRASQRGSRLARRRARLSSRSAVGLRRRRSRRGCSAQARGRSTPHIRGRRSAALDRFLCDPTRSPGARRAARP